MTSQSSQDGFHPATIIASTTAATLSLLALLRLSLYPRHPQTLKSPLHTVIPSLTPAELDNLEYKPDAFPGARDVETPYGSVRVYEFGPETGQKVLLLHGISTSCQTLTHIAHRLVAGGGYRVMLFDLFGRGFSDTPSDLPHDARLYVSQTLIALASSPLSWTGKDAGVKVVGYSMGGGVATHFVASFPGMVESLALLAPAGMIRPEKFGRLANFVYRSGMVPGRVLGVLTRRRLERPIASGVKGGTKKHPGNAEEEMLLGSSSSTEDVDKDNNNTSKKGPVDAALAEAADDDEGRKEELEPSTGLEVKVLRYVQWMVRHHAGFIPAFMASLRDAPLMGQHGAYARLAATGMPVAVVFGSKDTVVDERGYREDGLEIMGGEDKVMWRVVDGGHDFPMTNVEAVMGVLEEFWGKTGA